MLCSEIGQINFDMLYSRHRNFVDSDTLKKICQQLNNSAGWIYRTNFWRFYLVNGLEPYSEAQPHTWYGRQLAFGALQDPWRGVFERVIQLAGAEFVVQRYALTGQTQSQHQTLHYDTSLSLQGNFRSYLIYLNDKWDQAMGGTTDFMVNDQLVHQEYPEPGKLIEFNSQTLHCGNPPDVPNVLRLSLVIHGQIV